MTGDLFEYGIQTEVSDIRAHVSVCNKTLYVFPTRNGVEAIARHDPPLRDAGQAGVKGRTAEGWLVRIEWISDIRKLAFLSWPGWSAFGANMTTSEKGALAVKCVRETMRIGKFPFWVDADEDDRENVQIKGTDILVFCRKRVQVKCDWRAGETGNLFLQRAERNPLNRI
jgi:hypothetical protein